ncbi:unnamed protein product [Soboliphyme baturini]|uniref:Phe_ZIP domain-containing protein n=1 Tax=Soboliphyme baturini TaxID=241478 RepID=A0A183ICU4_9BILA|nr:unnamed protein product [Soboliphyme baturini]
MKPAAELRQSPCLLASPRLASPRLPPALLPQGWPGTGVAGRSCVRCSIIASLNFVLLPSSIAPCDQFFNCESKLGVALVYPAAENRATRSVTRRFVVRDIVQAGCVVVLVPVLDEDDDDEDDKAMVSDTDVDVNVKDSSQLKSLMWTEFCEACAKFAAYDFAQSWHNYLTENPSTMNLVNEQIVAEKFVDAFVSYFENEAKRICRSSRLLNESVAVNLNAVQPSDRRSPRYFSVSSSLSSSFRPTT